MPHPGLKFMIMCWLMSHPRDFLYMDVVGESVLTTSLECICGVSHGEGLMLCTPHNVVFQ
jgi:hypothetical protein